MHARRLVAVGLLLGGLLLGMSCSGPSADRPAPADTDAPARVYLVQLGMTEKKAAAHRTLGAALDWWETHAESLDLRPLKLRTSTDRVAHIEWKAPYYRVRLGPFASQKEARSVLEKARSAFPDAFVAPDRPSPQATAP